MIGFLRGELVEKQPPHLMVDVQGVGYELEAPMSTFYALPEIGQPVRLYTHLAIRDDAHILFGFSGLGERGLFRSLIRVNGVGAKMALAILSGMDGEGFARCVREEDTATLVRLPGIGKKTAERLIIEMRDRLPERSGSGTFSAGAAAGSAPPSASQEAVGALVALGYKPADAARMVKAVAGEGLAAEALIRAALQGQVA